MQESFSTAKIVKVIPDDGKTKVTSMVQKEKKGKATPKLKVKTKAMRKKEDAVIEENRAAFFRALSENGIDSKSIAE